MRSALAAGAVALFGCWTNPPPASPSDSARPTPRAQATEKELLDAAAGSFSPDGQFQPGADVPHLEGTLFGWRIRLACSDQEVRFVETVVLPGPGDWGIDDNSTLSDDRSTARTTVTEVCNPDGWIEKIWGLAKDDPPGVYTISVKVDGYREHIFKLNVVDVPHGP